MRHVLMGTTMPVLEMHLDDGEAIVAEPGEFSWMSTNIQLNTLTQTAGARGLFSVFGRALAGGGLFMTEYRAFGGEGIVAFAARVPGTIHEIQIESGQSYLVHRGGFLCATEGVQVSIAVQQKLGVGLFGGEGFILQRLAGPCTAFVELGGETVSYDLQAGQSIMVHPGHVGMFTETVGFDINMVRGIRNALFGADGLFMARLTGPGRVWLQSMTVANLAHAIEPYLRRDGVSGNIGAGATGGVAGDVAGSIIRDIFR